MTAKIKIIGAGVIGLTTGIVLQDNGFNTQIITKDHYLDTTSAVAAGIWEPYHAGNHIENPKWYRKTFDVCKTLEKNSDTGVFFTDLYEYSFEDKYKIPVWADDIDEFLDIPKKELPEGCLGGFKAVVPYMGNKKYMPFLYNSYLEKGGKINKGHVNRFSDEASDADIIINCTGINSRELCQDEDLYSGRGQVIIFENEGLKHSIASDEFGITYILPQQDICVVGGTFEENEYDFTPQERTTEDILKRAYHLEPRLKNMKILDVKVGLRPCRSKVRLEREQLTSDCDIIHNYGHGGAGYTLSWGCAEEVLKLI